MKAYGATHVGRVRAVNQDAYYLPEAGESFAVVADGMGGHKAGEVASAMAVSEFTRWLRCAPVPTEETVNYAVHEANRIIHRTAQHEADKSNMGTTLVSVWVDDEQVIECNVGDSRAYLLRGGALTKTAPAAVDALYEAAVPGRSRAEWAFRYLLDRPEVTTILSGMTYHGQLEENLRIFDGAGAGCLSAQEKETLCLVRRAYEERTPIGCTGCGYCQPCPHGVDIPGVFRCWNEIGVDGAKRARREYLQTTAMRSPSTGAGQCVGCGKCAAVCPAAVITIVQREVRV